MSNRLACLGGSPVRTRVFPAWPVFGDEEEKELLRVLHSGSWGRLDGDETNRFEQRFAHAHGAEYGIAVNNGTVALRIALLALDLEPGAEVIVPPYTFLATATSVIEANATPVFADIDPDTCNLDLAAVEAAITPRTRAIIPVHFAGLPVDMDAFITLGRRHDLAIIEDAAHAHGAHYKGVPVGALGDLGCFSFQSSKNMTSGEGGIIITNDARLADRCRSIHNCGRLPGGVWYEHHIISGNYRLSEFQSAILNCQLDRLESQAGKRHRNGQTLRLGLAGLPGLDTQQWTIDGIRHAYHLFVLRYDESFFGVPRDMFVRFLNAEGIPATEGYPLPLYRQPLFLNKAFGPYTACIQTHPDLDYGQVVCPHCERVCASEGIWLKQSMMLGSEEDMRDILLALAKMVECREEMREALALGSAAQ